jgi:hypothetical protein
MKMNINNPIGSTKNKGFFVSLCRKSFLHSFVYFNVSLNVKCVLLARLFNIHYTITHVPNDVQQNIGRPVNEVNPGSVIKFNTVCSTFSR